MIQFYPTPAENILRAMQAPQKARALCEMPNVCTLLCATFPYYCGNSRGNISLYARAMDYHVVARKILEDKRRALCAEYPKNKFIVYLDSAVYPEVLACAAAGLGVVGRNNLLLTPEYGSYVFCGIIATDFDFGGLSSVCSCTNCGKCIAACPGKALGENTFCSELCISSISQQKQDLTPAQLAVFRAQGMIWGCDECQKCCPYNAGASKTNIPEFATCHICSLGVQDIINLTKKEFTEKYPNRAFTWRGAAPLLRNLNILEIK